MDDAVRLAVAVARLEAWLALTGGRAEIALEPRGGLPTCPVVRLHRDGHTTHEGSGWKGGFAADLPTAVHAAVDRATGRG